MIPGDFVNHDWASVNAERNDEFEISLFVIPVALDFFSYVIGHEVPDRFSFAYGIADLRGGKFEHRRVENSYARAEIIGYLKAGAFVNDKGILFHQRLKVFPSPEVLKTVAAHDHAESVLRVFFLQIGKGIDGIRWLG